MLRPIILFSAITFAGPSCSNSKLKGPVVPGEGIEHNNDIEQLSPDETPLQGTEGTLPSETIEEVSPPANISGAYLACSEARPATASLPEVLVNCGLKDEISNGKVNLVGTYTNPRWTYKTPAQSTLALTVQELPDNPDWHVQFTVKGPTLSDVLAQMGSISFTLEVEDAGRINRQESSTIRHSLVQWLPLDGAKIPTQAVVGGTENEGARNLYICRVHYGNEVIPGLLAAHFNDPNNKSICYAASNGVSIVSNSSDGLSVLYKSDVLVINAGAFAEYFEWLPASNGQLHSNAYVSGYDATGQPLYSCRGTQADGVVVEQTPGSLKQGSPGCVFNFNGSQTRTDYEVLSWKQTAPQ
ncbi:DM9 repeat-containing protein [Oligoflexus tunisiensis]|uniref:DM9 repeat-containing protein n=1 Tax=Oligoflexus tunisiensis TaxID=708132 RepID=UPI00114CFC3A|nr:DM9 repeat-containing protein [Oligoflexus tunisiensis]